MSPILVTNVAFVALAKALGLGGCVPIFNRDIENMMAQRQYNLGVLSGGFYDMQFSSPDKYMVYTGKWRYYIKRALKYDYDIAFKWIFGENDMYRMFPSFEWSKRIPFFNTVKRFAARTGFCFTLFYGRWYSFYPRTVCFKLFGYYVSTKKYTDVLKKMVPESDEYNQTINAQIEEIYQLLKDKIKIRFDYSLSVLESDPVYGNRRSSYAIVESDEEIQNEFCR